jgi:hypothetical protein
MATFVVSKTLAKVNNHPRGVNSANLVTLGEGEKETL